MDNLKVALLSPLFHPVHSVFQKAICNDQFLNFRCPFINPESSDLTIETLHHGSLKDTNSSMNLKRLIDGSKCSFCCIEFCHGGDSGNMGIALILQDRRPIDECPRSIQFRRHLCQFELYGLKFGDGTAELYPLLGIVQGRIKAACPIPTAAAPTDIRNTSRVFMAILNPSPTFPKGFLSAQSNDQTSVPQYHGVPSSSFFW